MKRLIAALAVVLAAGLVGPLAAQTMSSKDSPPPAVQPVPVVLGEVTNQTSHSATVKTTRGETMTFEVDSRTVMPMQAMIGKRVKIEFHLMENGAHHAGRITMLEPGSADWERYDQEVAMGVRSEEHQEMERTSSMNHEREMSTNHAERSEEGMEHHHMESGETAAQERAEENAEHAGKEKEELPRTASRQPLILGLGLAALALGVAVGLSRRRRSV